MRAGRRLIAVVGAAVMGAAAVAASVTSPAGAAPPGSPDGAAGSLEPALPAASSTVELAPDGTDVTDVVIGSHAVVVVSTNGSAADVHRRTLTATPGGTYVGDATLVGQTLPYNVVAEYDGTIAYARASDEALVLEDAAGTETVPAWGGERRFAQGVTDLSSHWVVGRDSAGWVRLWNRQTGAEVPLGELAGIPASYPYHQVGTAFVTDDRVVWNMDTYDADVQSRFTGVYTAALDDDGVTGPVTTIDTGVQSAAGTGAVLTARGVDGTQVTWVRSDCVEFACVEEAHWYTAAPYSGTPSELSVTGRWSRTMTGTTMALVTPFPSVVVEWVSLAASDPTLVRSVDLPGLPRGMDDRFVAYSDGDGWLLSDASGTPLTDVPPPDVSFSDVPPGHPFYDDIMWLAGSGITGGYPDGTFRPAASVTRGAMAVFLYRLANDGADAPACTASAFTDVPAAHQFCGEIAWLASTGITTGWPDHTFRPTQPVTRAAMAAFLYRFDHGPGPAPACTAPPFVDVDVSHPFCGEIAWMDDAGISTGWLDGTYRPSLSIARQAIAAFLHRFALLP